MCRRYVLRFAVRVSDGIGVVAGEALGVPAADHLEAVHGVVDAARRPEGVEQSHEKVNGEGGDEIDEKPADGVGARHKRARVVAPNARQNATWACATYSHPHTAWPGHHTVRSNKKKQTS